VICGEKIVTAEEMVRIEKLAYEAGFSEEAFMESAGRGIAEKTLDFIETKLLEKESPCLLAKAMVVMLVAKHLLLRVFCTAVHTSP
jgi:NAD(P)H-hydrate repair Nnr-like enzyme with NAD(P)H-hydrate epimerase domain